MASDEAIRRFLQKTPGSRLEVASGEGSLSGLAVEIEDRTGLATRVAAVRLGPNVEGELASLLGLSRRSRRAKGAAENFLDNVPILCLFAGRRASRGRGGRAWWGPRLRARRLAQVRAARGFVDEDEGDGVGGVRGVRLAGRRVDHLLAVAVVGGDDGAAARGRSAFVIQPEAVVDVLRRPRWLLARLPVWPTMSGLAKLMMKTSVSPSSMARRILSVTL